MDVPAFLSTTGSFSSRWYSAPDSGYTQASIEKTDWPEVLIKDVPRHGHRGFMLDIARNFHDANKIKDVLDLMSLFKLNYLDLRMSDDEGWRIEIPGLPELTSVGSERPYLPLGAP